MIDYRAAVQIASPTSVSPAGKLQFSRQSNKNPLIPPIRVVFTAEFKRTAPRAPLVSHFRQTFRPVSASVLTTFETVFGGRGALQDISLSPTSGSKVIGFIAEKTAVRLVQRPSVKHWAVGLQTFFDHVFQQISHAIAVAPLVVVPTHELEEAFVQLEAGALIEN